LITSSQIELELMKQVADILKDIRPEFAFSISGDFIADGMLDSFDITMLVSALDKNYAISIEGVEIIPENFKNFETIDALLRKHGVNK
jgi:acyl carrier protein